MSKKLILCAMNETVRTNPGEQVVLGTRHLGPCVALRLSGNNGRESLTHTALYSHKGVIEREVKWLVDSGATSIKFTRIQGTNPDPMSHIDLKFSGDVSVTEENLQTPTSHVMIAGDGTTKFPTDETLSPLSGAKREMLECDLRNATNAIEFIFNLAGGKDYFRKPDDRIMPKIVYDNGQKIPYESMTDSDIPRLLKAGKYDAIVERLESDFLDHKEILRPLIEGQIKIYASISQALSGLPKPSSHPLPK